MDDEEQPQPGSRRNPLTAIIHAIDWLLMALFTFRRPQTLDDANARYLDGLDAMGNRIGSNVGGNARPGERLPPRD